MESDFLKCKQCAKHEVHTLEQVDDKSEANEWVVLTWKCKICGQMHNTKKRWNEYFGYGALR